MLRLLLAAGVDPSLTNVDGQTPYSIAVAEQADELAVLLRIGSPKAARAVRDPGGMNSARRGSGLRDSADLLDSDDANARKAAAATAAAAAPTNTTTTDNNDDGDDDDEDADDDDDDDDDDEQDEDEEKTRTADAASSQAGRRASIGGGGGERRRRRVATPKRVANELHELRAQVAQLSATNDQLAQQSRNSPTLSRISLKSTGTMGDASGVDLFFVDNYHLMCR
jgi:hypothetical protein